MGVKSFPGGKTISWGAKSFPGGKTISRGQNHFQGSNWLHSIFLTIYYYMVTVLWLNTR